MKKKGKLHYINRSNWLIQKENGTGVNDQVTANLQPCRIWIRWDVSTKKAERKPVSSTERLDQSVTSVMFARVILIHREIKFTIILSCTSRLPSGLFPWVFQPQLLYPCSPSVLHAHPSRYSYNINYGYEQGIYSRNSLPVLGPNIFLILKWKLSLQFSQTKENLVSIQFVPLLIMTEIIFRSRNTKRINCNLSYRKTLATCAFRLEHYILRWKTYKQCIHISLHMISYIGHIMVKSRISI